MALHKIKKGLDLPLAGAPAATVEAARSPRRVAVVAADSVGLRPTMHVQAGDAVRRGQLLFEDKKTPGLRYTSPGSGTVVGVNRGERRALQSVVVELGDDERAGRGETVRFAADSGKHPAELDGDAVKALLVESGLFTALRARPFGKVADPATKPRSIFVTAMDSSPHAPDLALALEGREEDLERGLVALAKLTDGPVYVCVAPGTRVPAARGSRVRVEEFSGPHPAGTAGVHIHLLDPVWREKLVWQIGVQDVLAIGVLFHGGRLDVDRLITLGGPAALRPRHLRTRLGTALDDLVEGEAAAGEVRVVSGSVLSGRTAKGEVSGFLGRYHQQVSLLHEGREREFLGWLAPGASKYSTTGAFLSSLIPGKRFAMTTTTNGSDRAMVPIGTYERVFPIDIPATFLLRALLVGDVERAEQLGVLELDEEDLGLCTFVCPGKHDYGPHLRSVLTTIEKEG